MLKVTYCKSYHMDGVCFSKNGPSGGSDKVGGDAKAAFATTRGPFDDAFGGVRGNDEGTKQGVIQNVDNGAKSG